jgi:plasmid stabilization system protein ParE
VKVRLTEPAEFDLERLADDIADIDPLRAKEFAQRLQAAARVVGRSPFLCPPLKVNPRFRKKTVRPYLILFEIGDSEVLILRIIHERSDWASLI